MTGILRAALADSGTTMWRFQAALPVDAAVRPVSLGEGGTPLIRSRMDLPAQLYWKCENLNPTGSHKDRALSLTVTRAVAQGQKRLVICSTGSAGLACAAYAAAAGLECLVLVPMGTPHERLRPMMFLGAHVFEVAGGLTATTDLVYQLARRPGWCDATTQGSSNPMHSEAGKTIAFEIFSDLGAAPDVVVIPVGGAGTLIGIAKGFEALRAEGLIQHKPRLVSVQPEHFNSLEIALSSGMTRREDVDAIRMAEARETVLRNLKHGYTPDAFEAVEMLRGNDGIAVSVSDAAALDWQRRMAVTDGIFCEPSSAASGAALDKIPQLLTAGQSVVALVTGSGLREQGILPARVIRQIAADITVDRVEALLEDQALPAAPPWEAPGA